MNPAPEIVVCEIFTVPVPVLVMLRLWVELLPTEILPKLRLMALGDRIPVPGFCDWPAGPVYPAQLARTITARMAVKGATKAKGQGCLDSLEWVRFDVSSAAKTELGWCGFMTSTV